MAIEREWAELSAQMKAHRDAGTDPSEREVRALAERWGDLTERQNSRASPGATPASPRASVVCTGRKVRRKPSAGRLRRRPPGVESPARRPPSTEGPEGGDDEHLRRAGGRGDTRPQRAEKAALFARPGIERLRSPGFGGPKGWVHHPHVGLHVNALVPLTVDLRLAPAHLTRRKRRSPETPSPSIPPAAPRCL